MKFTKMHGAGNDYVYIDCIKERDVDAMDSKQISDLAKIMSSRNYGVGSDGLILIKKGDKTEFKMEMYNSDGTSSEMCGNGLRCVVKYLHDELYSTDNIINVETGAGVLSAEITRRSGDKKAELIKVNMGKPVLDAKSIPVIWKKGKDRQIIDEKLPVRGHYMRFTAVSMGNPHCVIFMPDHEGLNNMSLTHYGREIEYLEIFPHLTNVEFVFVHSINEIYQRTWERGSEETLACGTGACASVVAGILTGRLDRDKVIKDHLKGGDLNVFWDTESDCVFLEGNAVRVFDGEWMI